MTKPQVWHGRAAFLCFWTGHEDQRAGCAMGRNLGPGTGKLPLPQALHRSPQELAVNGLLEADTNDLHLLVSPKYAIGRIFRLLQIDGY